jgi:hypothetical protein
MNSQQANNSSNCLLAEMLVNNVALWLIIAIKTLVSIGSFIFTAKINFFRYSKVAFHKNIKILVFFVHYFAIYLLCLTNGIPHLYFLIKFIAFKIAIGNYTCSMDENNFLDISDTACLLIGIASMFAVYLMAMSLTVIAIERMIATIRFRTYEHDGTSIAVLLILAVV